MFQNFTNLVHKRLTRFCEYLSVSNDPFFLHLYVYKQTRARAVSAELRAVAQLGLSPSPERFKLLQVHGTGTDMGCMGLP